MLVVPPSLPPSPAPSPAPPPVPPAVSGTVHESFVSLRLGGAQPRRRHLQLSSTVDSEQLPDGAEHLVLLHIADLLDEFTF